MDTEERWARVEDHPAYSVSDKGRIRRDTARTSATVGRILRPSLVNGYLAVSLTKNSRRRPYSIHRMVAKAFVMNPKGYPQVNHINGVKTDNRAENLEWVTASANTLHAVEIGLKPFGVRHPKAKLTPDAVFEIRASTESNADLARRFGVDHKTLVQARRGVTWKQVPASGVL